MVRQTKVEPHITNCLEARRCPFIHLFAKEYFSLVELPLGFKSHLMSCLFEQIYSFLDSSWHSRSGRKDSVLCIEADLHVIVSYNNVSSSWPETLRGQPGLASWSLQGTGALQSLAASFDSNVAPTFLCRLWRRQSRFMSRWKVWEPRLHQSPPLILLLFAHIFCIDATFSENDVSKFTISRPGLLPYSNIKRMTTILGRHPKKRKVCPRRWRWRTTSILLTNWIRTEQVIGNFVQEEGGGRQNRYSCSDRRRCN